MCNQAELDRAAALLAGADRIACLTGAGVSAESGVATFRDAQTGLWAHFDPQQLASQAGFRSDPGLVWRWYMERLQKVETTEPNPAHRALARLQQGSAHFVLVTQNVDDLHERAGSNPVIHLHGTLSRFRCNGCRANYPLQPADRTAEEPPRCPKCGDRVRPDVVWFGEMLPALAVEQAWAAAGDCDVMLVVGTSGAVYPAAQLPFLARRSGARIIDVNPEPGPMAEMADVALKGAAGQILPRLLQALDRSED